MAGINIHKLIAMKYIEKHSDVDNIEGFYKGCIIPDLVEDKKISHYSDYTKQDFSDLPEAFKYKTMLNWYLKEHRIDSSYELGMFLHLVTDYLWFNKFIDKEYLSNTTFEKFQTDYYYSLDIVDSYIEDKYKILSYKRKKYKFEDKYIIKNNIIPINKLERFIQYVTNINLKEYAKKIINADCNIMPDLDMNF